MERWSWWLCSAVVVLLVAGLVDGLRFDVPPGATKCVADDIQSNVLVLVDYSVVSAGDASHRITVKVTSPYGQQLHYQEQVQSGQFGFTTKESGNYMACFWMRDAPPTLTLSIDLDWKTGAAAKDWEDIAKKDRLEGLELELRKLEESVESIHSEMLYLRDREKEMRDLNETTNSRVAWFSIMSLFICLCVAGWQLWHLKSFFERKSSFSLEDFDLRVIVYSEALETAFAMVSEKCMHFCSHCILWSRMCRGGR